MGDQRQDLITVGVFRKFIWKMSLRRSDVTWNIFIISANNGLLDSTFYGISRILDGPRLIKSKLYGFSEPFFTHDSTFHRPDAGAGFIH